MTTKKEILKKITELEAKMFYLDMKDVWTQEDYQLDRMWLREITELKKRYRDLEAVQILLLF